MPGRWLGDGWDNTRCIRTPNTTTTISTTQNHTVHISPKPNGWEACSCYFKKNGCESESPGDDWEMAGRWLGHARAMSKDFRCNMKSQQDGLEMTGWLAPTNSKYFGWSCRSPRDGWEMAGRFSLAISKESGCHFGSLGNGWQNTSCIRTLNTNERPFVQHKTIQYK